MASTSAALSTASLTTASLGTRRGVSNRRRTVIKIGGLNSYSGLKALNCVASLGVPVSTEQGFVNLVNSINRKSKGIGRGGGAHSATCNASSEIFNIVLIMNGLTLVGVAIGFVLLRIEAFVEETEEA